MKPIHEFLAELDQQQIKFKLDGDQLRIRAAQQVLTPTVTEQLRLRKEEILAFLRGRPAQPTVPALQALPRPAVLPLSYAQERLWFLAAIEGQSATYNIPLALRLQGALDPVALAAALNGLVQRHEILRTSFPTVDGVAQQVITPHLTLALPLIDLRATPAAERESAVQQQLKEAAAQPFDLAVGPLLRATLYQLAAQEHILLLTFHHIITDGWSLGIVLRELDALYRAALVGEPPALPPLPHQYADFALWQRQWLHGDRLQAQLSWWQQQLAAAPTLLDLPTDHPRPAVQRFRGSTVDFTLDAALTTALEALSRQHGTSLFMTLYAAFAVLLMRYSGQDDIVIGTPIANRHHRGLEPLIGFFVNTLPLRADLQGNPSFLELLQRVRQTTLDAYAHQDIPFEQVVNHLPIARSLSHNPLFQVMMTLDTTPENTASVAQPLGDLTAMRVDLENIIARFDLTLELVKTGDILKGWLDYNGDLFEAETMTRMVSHFQELLKGIVVNPQQAIAQFSLLTASERHQLLVEWNDTTTDYPNDKYIHQLFEEQVARTPEAVAVMFEAQALTYRALNMRANQLAHHLQSLGVGPETLVGLCVERSVEMVVGLLGILKAGGAYLPLDPTYPQDRLAFMLQDADVSVLLTQAHLAANLSPTKASILCLDRDWPQFATQSTNNPLHEGQADHLAYVIYTSGSTGRPKGTMNTHRGLCNLLYYLQDTHKLTPADKTLQTTVFSFDVATSELFWPLLNGAGLVLTQPDGQRDSGYLVDMLQRHQITTLHLVPSLLQMLLEESAITACTSLKRAIVAGEALPVSLQARFFARLPHAELHNLYGPTETAIYVTAWHCLPQSKQMSVPIGRPIANTQIHILDQQLQPIPIGVPGELHIAGIQVGLGYLNRPVLTKEKFIANPFGKGRLYKTGDLTRWLPDGNIEYLGRIDHQVKLRGFRIELGEIEAVLSQHPAVQEAVVVVREDERGTKKLVAYVVQRRESATPPGEGVDPITLRSYLQPKLPEHMMPTAFVVLVALPLTPNGKVDRKALPTPTMSTLATATEFVPAQTPTEKQLAAIWTKVLGLAQTGPEQSRRIGIHDNFFALGGDSILSIQVLAQAKQAGLNLSLQQLFQQQTIQALAATLDSQAGDSQASPVPTALPPTLAFDLLSAADRQQILSTLDLNEIEDAYPLSALQAGMVFHSELAADSAVYHDIFSYQLQAPFNLAAFQQAVQSLTQSHAVLRTSFALVNFTEPLQLVQRAVTVPINVVDWRGLSVEAQNEALEAWFATEKQRPFLWQQAPLLRLQLHRRTDEQFNLTLSFHHAILDGWSVATLLTELLQRYFAGLQDGAADNQIKPAALTVHFRDFVALERAALADDANQRYWQTTLQDATILKLPRWPQAQSQRSAADVATWPVAFPAEVEAALHQLARRAGVPLKSVLLAAHLNVLRVLGNQTDVLTGLASNGRPEVEQGERVLGLFLNALPLRLPLTDGTWLELIQQVFAQERQLLPYRRYPLASIQEQLGGSALFEVLFNFVNFHVYDQLAEHSALTFVDDKYFNQTNFALVTTFSLDAHNHISLDLTYDPHEFCAQQMTLLAGYYTKTLQAMSSQPTLPYAACSLLTEAERHQLLIEWNATATDYPKEKCIHHLFEEQVERTPEAVAVVYDLRFTDLRSTIYDLRSDGTNDLRSTIYDLRSDGTNDDDSAVQSGREETTSSAHQSLVNRKSKIVNQLTYRELNERSNQLAHHLQSLGVGPETLVGLCVERSLEMVVGLLGILKAGGAYLPLDPTYPPERLAFMLEDTAVSVLLTQAHLQAQLPPTPASIVCLDRDWPQIATAASSTPASAVQADNLAYVMYTSGSTGRPKGVSVIQRNVVRLVQKTNFARLTADEVFLQLAPISFDAATLEIWGPLLNGGRLVVMAAGQPSLEAIGNAIRQHGVTTLWLTAGLFHLMVDEHLEDLRPLRQLLAGGDVLSVAHVQRFLQTLPHCQLINGYGPTENTTFTCCYAFPTGAALGASAPIGRPIANTQVYILDEQMQPVPVGVAGELYAGGDGVAREYFNRPDLTAEKFITNPFGPKANPGPLYKTGDLARWLPDGNIEFLGRIDQQVKLRGFRIELGEIEAALGHHPAVQEAVVVAHKAENGEPRLVAYVVTNDKMTGGQDDKMIGSIILSSCPPVIPSDLRDYLRQKLPDYMIPSRFMVVDALPLNASGKVDRKALPAPDLQGTTNYARPRTLTEEKLATIWREVLRVDGVGIHDNFFELGGHSLLAVRLLAQIRQRFERSLPLPILFQYPTVATLATYLEEEAPLAWSSLVALQPHGEKRPFFCVPGAGGNVFYFYPLMRALGNQQPFYGLESVGLDGREPPHRTVEEAAAYHLGELKRRFPQGPYLLGGHSFGGLVAFELAQQLLRAGETVGALVLMDTHAPQAQRPVQDEVDLILVYERLFSEEYGTPAMLRREELTPLSSSERLLRLQAALEAIGALPAGHPVTELQAMFQVYQTNYQTSYAPQNAMPLPIQLFVAQEQPDEVRRQISDGWRQWGDVVVHAVPGSHTTMTYEPHVQTLAQEVAACLAL